MYVVVFYVSLKKPFAGDTNLLNLPSVLPGDALDSRDSSVIF